MIRLTIPGEPLGKARPRMMRIRKWPINIEKEKIIFSIEFQGNPIAHERVRVRRSGKSYIPSKTRNYKNSLAWYIKLKIQNIDYKDNDKSIYGIQAIFYRGDRQRIDLDNLLKTILDSITLSGFWSDDSKVAEIAGRLEKIQANPRVNFMVYLYDSINHIETSQDYTFQEKCSFCGGPMSLAKSKSYPCRKGQFCSKECFYQSRKIKLKCSYCGKDFEIPKSLLYQKTKKGKVYKRSFCSRDCSINYWRQLKRKKGKESDNWICSKCGSHVSRKEYKVCRGCSMKTRSDPNSNYWKLRHGIENIDKTIQKGLEL